MSQSQMDQSPAEEVAERLAVGLPGLGLAASAVGLEDHRRMLHEHAKRVREGHLWQARQAGETTSDPESVMMEKGNDDMGDITITGDINVQNPEGSSQLLKSLLKTQSPEPSNQQPTKSEMSPLKAALLATGLTLATGAAGATAYHYMSPGAPSPVVDEDIQYDVQKWVPPGV